MAEESTGAADALREVRAALESTAGDFESMPFFVRPMVRRGFARRTGASLDEWITRISRAVAAAERGDRPIALIGDLEKLADNFRTAPDRARRGMKGEALRRMTERSRDRERAVRTAIEALR